MDDAQQQQYVPSWEGVFQDYARSFVARNHWRISWRHDYQDALGIAAEVFARILHVYTGKSHPRYGRIVEPRHWMALYKQALSNEFHTQSRETRQYIEAQRTWGEEELGRSGDQDQNGGALLSALSTASTELREVLSIVARAPAELLEVLLEASEPASWSRRLCRLTRIGTVSDTIVSELQSLCWPQVDDSLDLIDLGFRRVRWASSSPSQLRKRSE